MNARSFEALQVHVKQHKVKTFSCFFLFYPYKTSKTKEKRKAFNWYKNTYINQATLHFLFINHIHIQKLNLQLYHLYCRLENKPNINEYCLTFFCTPKPTFILDAAPCKMFQTSGAVQKSRLRSKARCVRVQLKRLPSASTLVCYHSTRMASTEVTSVSSKSAHQASMYLVFLKQTQKHCRSVGSQVTSRHHLSFYHLQSQTCHAHQPQDLMKVQKVSVTHIYFCRLPIFKLSLSVTKYDNIFIIARFI